MQSFIERLEEASEPSRGLDAEIFKIAKPVHAKSAYWRAAPGVPDQRTLWKSTLGNKSVQLAALHYTSSVDAALTLVPEGWYTGAACEDAGGSWSWSLYGKGRNVATASWHPTPALALCIAALRARKED